MIVSKSVLFLALGLAQYADGFSAPVPQNRVAVSTNEPVTRIAPPPPQREMPPPYGAVQDIEGRVPGTHNQPPGNKWWEPAGMYGTHGSINTSSGTFSTYTDSVKNPYNPKDDGPDPVRVAGAYNQQATGNWWDRPGQIESHESINTSAGFPVYSDILKGPTVPKDDGPNPVRVAGAYNQQASGNWWDRPGQIESHESINTSSGFPVYSDMLKGPTVPKDDGPNPARVAGAYNQQASGNWWDRPGQIQSHESIKTSAGFPVYSDMVRGPATPKDDGPNPARVAGAYNQQATGNWWDRRGPIETHDSIKNSAGFPVYTDDLRQRSQ